MARVVTYIAGSIVFVMYLYTHKRRISLIYQHIHVCRMGYNQVMCVSHPVSFAAKPGFLFTEGVGS